MSGYEQRGPADLMGPRGIVHQMSTCAALSRELAEPLAATAVTATTWLLLEQAGPWGAKALTESHLDPDIGRSLERAAKGTGVRIALIRRPGRHAGPTSVPGCHQVVLAHTLPGASWVRHGTVADPADLLDLDFPALGSGDVTGFGTERTGEPLALVCTNARRDRCCALLGRPLAAELAAAGHGDVWEVTHLGGHRFSPTMLVLPYGYTYGRLTATTAKEVLVATAAGRMVPDWCRGRSAWERAGQAAELAVRRVTGEDRADVLTVGSAQAAGRLWHMPVRHSDGRVWRVEVEQSVSAPPRPESCGKTPGTPLRMDVRSVERDHTR